MLSHLRARKNVLQLQQFLGDQIRIRPNPKAAPKELWKSEILGDFWYTFFLLCIKTQYRKQSGAECSYTDDQL